jgi:seryl-tRNA synthetase
MLQVSFIREHQAEVIERLSKRTSDAQSLIDDVLKLDESRRGLQTQADAVSAELNAISKELGTYLNPDKLKKPMH